MPMTSNRARRLVALAAVALVALLAAACGSAEEPSAAPAIESASVEATLEATVEDMPSAPEVTEPAPSAAAPSATEAPTTEAPTTPPDADAPGLEADAPASDLPSGAVAIEVSGGEVAGGAQQVEATVGELLRLEVTADVADEVHVHGYDLTADVAPGQPAVVEFTADLPGVYEVELEDAGLQLAELRVQ